MPEEPAATVVIATRNRGHYLSDCLESLSRRDCDHPFEIIVIRQNTGLRIFQRPEP